MSIDVRDKQITSFIGPSGCGKSTLLRCFNRMNDDVKGCRIEGRVALDGEDIYREANPTRLRQRVGMVFQRPNPFPMSIYDNVAYGPRGLGVRSRSELDEIVEDSLRHAALWDEVKDKLKQSGLGLSGGQQQRPSLHRPRDRGQARGPPDGRADERSDPISTVQVEQLAQELRRDYTLVGSPITCSRRPASPTLSRSSCSESSSSTPGRRSCSPVPAIPARPTT